MKLSLSWIVCLQDRRHDKKHLYRHHVTALYCGNSSDYLAGLVVGYSSHIPHLNRYQSFHPLNRPKTSAYWHLFGAIFLVIANHQE